MPTSDRFKLMIQLCKLRKNDDLSPSNIMLVKDKDQSMKFSHLGEEKDQSTFQNIAFFLIFGREIRDGEFDREDGMARYTGISGGKIWDFLRFLDTDFDEIE